MMKEEALRTLETLFDRHQLVKDPVELMTYEVDAGLNRGHPDAVVYPLSQDDVIRLARWAAKCEVPIVARSSGTGLSGGAVAFRGGVIVSFSKMNRILDVDEFDRLVAAEPGVVNLALDTQLRPRGFYFPPDPASQRASALGGNIAENAGGPHCFKYGVTTNYVRGLKIVLADGTVARTGGRACDYPEYDFTGLLCGSEGTLAIVTGAELKIIRSPTGFKTLIASFDSIEEAGEAVSAIIAQGLIPATLEMMDRNIAGIIEDFAHAGLPTDAAALLLAEVDGYPESLNAQVAEIEQVLTRQRVRRIHVCQTAEERERLWFARKSAFGAMARISPAYFQVDGTVPRSRLAETLSDINRICGNLELRVGYVFHAGDGNLHPLIPFDPADKDMERRVHRAGDEIMAACVSKNGSITGEHGVGIEKRKYMSLMYSSAELSAMYDVKVVFDPRGVLNPGKIFPEDFHPSPPQETDGVPQPLPLFFTPENEVQASDGLRAAQSLGQPVLIGSAPAGLSLGSGAAVLSTRLLTANPALSLEDLYVVAEAGVTFAELQTALAARGVWIPIASPWESEATVGGIVSAATNGPLQMRYGSVRDQVLGMNVVLPDGRCLRLGRPVVKNVAGYDLTRLFIGARGTLGLITRVIFKVTALPRARRSLIIPVQDLASGLRFGEALCHLSQVGSAVLLCPGNAVFEEPASAYYLVFTAEGHEQDVEAEMRAACSKVTGAETDAVTGVEIWKRTLNGAASHVRVGVPPKALPELMRRHGSAFREGSVLDIASGMVYVTPPPVEELSALRDTALSCGGYAVLSNEVGNMPIDPWGYVPDTLPLMRRLKARWDPKGVLNPGAFLV